MGMNWAEHTTEIEAPIETSFDAIVDYESFPGWQDAVDSVEVLSRTADGLGENVKLFVDAKVKKIDYTLRYSYTRPTEIRWDFVEGNGMRDVDGVYTLESLGPERTRATYKLGADPEIPVPGMVLRRTHKALVKRSVEDLKNEAERRHAAGVQPTAPEAPPEAPAAPAPGAAPHADPAPQARARPLGPARPPRPMASGCPRQSASPPPRRRAPGRGPSRARSARSRWPWRARASRRQRAPQGPAATSWSVERRRASTSPQGVASRIDRLIGRGR